MVWPAWCPAGPFCRTDPEQTAILALSGASTKRSSALFVLRMDATLTER